MTTTTFWKFGLLGLATLAAITISQVTSVSGAYADPGSSPAAAPAASPSTSPTPTPSARPTPPGLTLSTGIGISPDSASTVYSLLPNPGSSPPTSTIGFTDQYTNPSLSIVLQANFPAFPLWGKEWLFGSVGTGTNKTDLVAGVTLGGISAQSFLTIGVRQITTQELLNHVAGQTVPSNTALSNITFNRHSTRLYVGYTVNATALGCIIPIFKAPAGGCGSSSTGSDSASPPPKSGS